MCLNNNKITRMSNSNSDACLKRTKHTDNHWKIGHLVLDGVYKLHILIIKDFEDFMLKLV